MANIIAGLDSVSINLINTKPIQKNSHTSENKSFVEILSETSENILNSTKNAEQSVGKLAKGEISPETVIAGINIASAELESGMAIIKTAVESGKQILNIQI